MAIQAILGLLGALNGSGGDSTGGQSAAPALGLEDALALNQSDSITDSIQGAQDAAVQAPGFENNAFFEGSQRSSQDVSNLAQGAAQDAGFGQRFLTSILAKKFGGSLLGQSLFGALAGQDADGNPNFAQQVVGQMGGGGQGPMATLFSGLGSSLFGDDKGAN